MERIQKLEEQISDLQKEISALDELGSLRDKQISLLFKWRSIIDKDISTTFKNFSTIDKWKKSIISIIDKQDTASLENIGDQLEEIADLKREEHDARYKREHNL